MSALPVVALIKAKPGKEAEAEALLRALLAPTHAEKGCLLYALHRVTADPLTFIFIEKWETPEALQAHLRSPHILTGLAKQAELFDRLEILALDSLPDLNRQKSIL